MRKSKREKCLILHKQTHPLKSSYINKTAIKKSFIQNKFLFLIYFALSYLHFIMCSESQIIQHLKSITKNKNHLVMSFYRKEIFLAVSPDRKKIPKTKQEYHWHQMEFNINWGHLNFIYLLLITQPCLYFVVCLLKNKQNLRKKKRDFLYLSIKCKLASYKFFLVVSIFCADFRKRIKKT